MAEEKKAPEKQSAFSKFMSMNGASVFVAMLVVMVLFEIVIHIQRGGTGGLVFITPHNIMLIFRSMLYTGIIAFGMTLVMITGNIDLSVGSQLTFLCSVCAIFMINTDNAFVGIVGTLAVGAVCGLANGLLVSYLKPPSVRARYLPRLHLWLRPERYWLFRTTAQKHSSFSVQPR